MPLAVVVGGQYGSEGKGKLISHLVSRQEGEIAVVRCGGSNAGHSAESEGMRMMLRQLPSGAVDERCQLHLAAGMQLDLMILLEEIAATGATSEQLRIDPNATLIEVEDIDAERKAQLGERIGSTESGTGAALARKLMRADGVRRAADAPELQSYLTNVPAQLLAALDRGTQVIVEGTQGFGLSLHHGSYPYVTARETTASAFLSEVGLPPTRLDEVIVVLRTYPIRVAGNSGPMLGELSWEEIADRAGYPTALAEYTSVTGRLRRVGEFDWALAERAVRLNGATAIALHGLDYLDHSDLGATNWAQLGQRSRDFVERLEQHLGLPVRWLYTGPDGTALIDRQQPAALQLSRTTASGRT